LSNSRQNQVSQEFIKFALQTEVLLFGEFTTKAGRKSPYFFNAGRFSSGATLTKLGEFYAKTLLAAEAERGLKFDMLFGPAYKGITLAATTVMAFSQMGENADKRDLPFSYNRKEAKLHGEGGTIVGPKLAGNVVIIDDVITDGASKRESVEMIRAAGATPVAVLIALDRMERGGTAEQVSERSAVQDIEQQYGMPVLSIANLNDLMRYLKESGDASLQQHAAAVANYRTQYGVRA